MPPPTEIIPVDPNFPPVLNFPEAEATDLIAVAREHGREDVEAVVNQIRRWIGDPTALSEHGLRWGAAAQGAIRDANYQLDESLRTLELYWSGGAKDAYAGYAAETTAAAAANAEVFVNMANELFEVSRNLIEAYNIALNLIIDYGQYLATVTYGVAGVLTGVGAFDVLGIISDAINGFVDSVQDRWDQTKDILLDIRVASERFQVHTEGFVIPGAVGVPADPVFWNVNAAES